MTTYTEDQLRLARGIVSSQQINEGSRALVLDGSWDRTETMRCTLTAIVKTTELAAKMADTVSSIHVERRDDCLHQENVAGALTQARNAQTADHIADALRNFDHLKGSSDG